jgi:hypothetical protein
VSDTEDACQVLNVKVDCILRIQGSDLRVYTQEKERIGKTAQKIQRRTNRNLILLGTDKEPGH